jgi:hypothetical protein
VNRILDQPGLPAIIQHLDPGILIRLIRHVAPPFQEDIAFQAGGRVVASPSMKRRDAGDTAIDPIPNPR